MAVEVISMNFRMSSNGSCWKGPLDLRRFVHIGVVSPTFTVAMKSLLALDYLTM